MQDKEDIVNVGEGVGLKNERNWKTKGGIGPFTPIHMEDLGPVQTKSCMSVWGFLPRLRGPPATNAGNGAIIICDIVIRIIVPKEKRTVISCARLRDLASNYSNNYDLQEDGGAAQKNMMNMTVMVMN